jgi:hypothetical protein
MGTRKGLFASVTSYGALAAILFGLLTTATEGASVVFAGSSGTCHASVTFEQVGLSLQVTLVNTSLDDVLLPPDVLTAVFFTLSDDPTLTPVSAVISSNSTVLFGGTGPGGVVGGEWAYKNHLSGAPLDADEGISSSGLGLFGPSNRFPGSNLQGPANPDGLQYGITSAGDNPATGNGPVTGGNALIKNGVVFTLSGLPANYALGVSSISNVSFQYGTAASEPNMAGTAPDLIPEPSSWALVIGSLLTLVCFRRRC